MWSEDPELERKEDFLVATKDAFQKHCGEHHHLDEESSEEDSPEDDHLQQLCSCLSIP